MSYIFQSAIYDTSTQAHIAAAGEFLSAGGLNAKSDILNALSECSDEELASECDEGFGMSDPEAGGASEWFDLDEMAAAFSDIRENPAQYFDWDDE